MELAVWINLLFTCIALSPLIPLSRFRWQDYGIIHPAEREARSIAADYDSSIASSAASSITGTLSSRALSSLEPASSPATT